MRRITVVAMGLLCLIAVKPSSLVAGEKSVESSKADSGLRFLESGKGQSGVGEPSAVRAVAATSRASGLTASIASKRASGSLQVPVPAPAAQNEASATSSAWRKFKVGNALVFGAAAAVVAISAISSAGVPAAIAVLAGGIIIAAGVVSGYKVASLAERVWRKD